MGSISQLVNLQQWFLTQEQQNKTDENVAQIEWLVLSKQTQKANIIIIYYMWSIWWCNEVVYAYTDITISELERYDINDEDVIIIIWQIN